MVLKTVLLRGHHVSTLILSDFNLPFSGCRGRSSVNINVDLVTTIRSWYKHVLTSVVATDGGRFGTSRVADSQGVCATVSHAGTISIYCCTGHCVWVRQNHGVKIYPQFAHIGVGFTEGVGAGVRIRAG